MLGDTVPVSGCLCSPSANHWIYLTTLTLNSSVPTCLLLQLQFVMNEISVLNGFFESNTGRSLDSILADQVVDHDHAYIRALFVERRRLRGQLADLAGTLELMDAVLQVAPCYHEFTHDPETDTGEAVNANKHAGVRFDDS